MITTQSTIQNTASGKRGSIHHKAAYDVPTYRVPLIAHGSDSSLSLLSGLTICNNDSKINNNDSKKGGYILKENDRPGQIANFHHPYIMSGDTIAGKYHKHTDSASSIRSSLFVTPIESPVPFLVSGEQGKPDFKSRVLDLLPIFIRELLPQIDLKVTAFCLVWYVLSSVSSNLSKAILQDFPHPVGLTELQFITNASLCLCFTILVNYLHHPRLHGSRISASLRNFPDGVLPPYLSGSFTNSISSRFLTLDKVALMTTFPMGVFQFLGHITSYKATSMIPVSLVHSVKALSPIMTVCWYRIVKKRRFSPMTYYTLIPLITGVILTSSSNSNGQKLDSRSTQTHYFIIGLAFAAISMVIFVTQNIFSKAILTVKKKDLLPSRKIESPSIGEPLPSQHQLDKLTILFYCSSIGFLLTLPLFITREVVSSRSIFGDLSMKTLSLVAIYGVTHFLQAMLAFQLIGMLSPVNYSIANIMKRIVVIGVALAWESRLSSKQILGLMLTVLGLYGYDKWGSKAVE